MLRQKSVGAVIGLAIALSVMMMMMGDGGQALANDGKHQPNRVCPGFVILPNGYAVFSQEETDPGQQSGHSHGTGHGDAAMKAMKSHGDKAMKTMADKGHQQATSHGDHSMGKHDQMAMKKSHDQMKGHDHKAHQSHQSGDRSHLMGYQHGQAIVPKEKMLCVPVGSQTDTAWATVGSSKALLVTAESMHGPLAHNSRANEGLRLTIMKSGMKSGATEAINPSQVQVFVRMPHHDHRMAGGHGPANDPDVSGIVAQLDKNGRYTLPTIDFSMAGPWLVEVQVKDGAKTHKAYFAANVGEE